MEWPIRFSFIYEGQRRSSNTWDTLAMVYAYESRGFSRDIVKIIQSLSKEGYPDDISLRSIPIIAEFFHDHVTYLEQKALSEVFLLIPLARFIFSSKCFPREAPLQFGGETVKDYVENQKKECERNFAQIRVLLLETTMG